MKAQQQKLLYLKSSDTQIHPVNIRQRLKDKFLTYCCEALGLGLFMFSAGFFDAMLEYPGLPVRQHLPSALLRRGLVGSAMGLTALYILSSSFGKRSGAHINPSVTWVQYRLGTIDAIDSLFYIIFQFVGGSIGMYLIYILMPHSISHPDINYIVTKPLNEGIALAFILEFFISFLLMGGVLYTNSTKQLSKYTASLVAFLIALFITFEAPYSGMSMNPARTFASAIVANEWNSFWLYCIAPPLGMWCAELFVRKLLHKKLANVSLHND